MEDKVPNKGKSKAEDILKSKLDAVGDSPDSNSNKTQHLTQAVVSGATNKMADPAASSKISAAGPQPMPDNSFREMADAIKNMTQTIGSLVSNVAGPSQPRAPINDEDDMLYFDQDDEDEYASDDYDENELLGFANDGTPISKKRTVPQELPSKKLKFLEKMKTEASSEEPKGPKINSLLAENVTNFMRNKSDEAKLAKVMDLFNPPENCEGLDTIRVNDSIWRRISHDARTQDLKMQRVHNSLIKGVTAVVQMIDKLLHDWDSDTHVLPEESFGSIMDTATNAMKVLGNTNFELAMRCREFLRSAISPDYAYLCSANSPFSSKLFGEDVLKTIKELSDVNKVTNQVFHRRSYESYRGRSRVRGRGYAPRGEASRTGSSRGRVRGRGTRRAYRQSGDQTAQSPAPQQQ